MIKPGDRVRHHNGRDAFGHGTVLEINEETGTALVEWDNHRVARTTSALSTHQTHVNLTSLIRVSS